MSCGNQIKPRVKAPISREYHDTYRLIRENSLHTVCEEAACPNIGECWSKKHATVMIMGDTCTRACSFCNVKTGKGTKLDEFEPYNLAQNTKKLGLNHVVITSVTRDDLSDGGAEHFAKCIKAIREVSPSTTIEVLVPDFKKKENAIDIVMEARPDVLNHNMETISRLYKHIRIGAIYDNSLNLLLKAKQLVPEGFTKSGIMVGLGETEDEVFSLMDDLRSARVDFLTIGQYLRPTPKHTEVVEYVSMEKFELYKKIGQEKGFLLVASSPLTRSSYHAGDDFAKLKINRLKFTTI